MRNTCEMVTVFIMVNTVLVLFFIANKDTCVFMILFVEDRSDFVQIQREITVEYRLPSTSTVEKLLTFVPHCRKVCFDL